MILLYCYFVPFMISMMLSSSGLDSDFFIGICGHYQLFAGSKGSSLVFDAINCQIISYHQLSSRQFVGIRKLKDFHDRTWLCPPPFPGDCGLSFEIPVPESQTMWPRWVSPQSILDHSLSAIGRFLWSVDTAKGQVGSVLDKIFLDTRASSNQDFYEFETSSALSIAAGVERSQW